MKRLTPILISILVFVIFLLTNVVTAHALTNVQIRLTEDTVTQVSLSSENRYPLIVGNGYANLKLLRVDRPDLRFKVHNSSDVSVDFMVTQNVNSGFLIKTIGVGETYVFDIDFWNEYYDSLTPNQQSESLSTLYFCCSEDSTEGSLQVSYAGEEDTNDSTGDGTGTGSGDSTEDDDSGLFQSIKEFISGLFEDIPTWISNAVDSIGEFFANLIEKIGEFFSDVGEWIANAVKDIGDFFSLVGEWIGNAVTSIVEFIGDFFTDLFEPILGWFKNKENEEEAKQTIWQSLFDNLKRLTDKILGFTLDPIADFLNDLFNSDIVMVLSEIYEFPIIKQMIILAVAVLVVVGFLGLLITI